MDVYGCFRVNLMITVVNSRLIYGDEWLLMIFFRAAREDLPVAATGLASPAESKDFHKTFLCFYMTIVSPRLTTWFTWWLHCHSGCLHLRISSVAPPVCDANALVASSAEREFESIRSLYSLDTTSLGVAVSWRSGERWSDGMLRSVATKNGNSSGR